MAEKTVSSASTRVLLALVLPLVGLIAFNLLVTRQLALGGDSPGEVAVQLAGAGLVSWFLGWRWYGLKGIGLRGGRPLFASIGFAVLGWLAFMLARIALVEPGPESGQSSGAPFLFLLIFEAFCTQLWTFGLFFRTVAEWRGGLTAAVSSGILFGAIGLAFFQEAYTINLFAALFFIVWGILYGMIRLRTGSLLGMVIVQALQSWTAWSLFELRVANAEQLRNLYLVCSLLYGLIIWRLWPKRESDYRV